MLASPDISQQAYILWDLIHDRAHSHGELPFDPFMIRQRAPYWMYSLEELRCDLTAFRQAIELERSGVAFARHVQYAILLDRLLRFPIAGGRVRNYDGLGGQLLFAYLHRHGYLRWTDNQLTIDWERVAEGSGRCTTKCMSSTAPVSIAPSSSTGQRHTTGGGERPSGRGVAMGGLGARAPRTWRTRGHTSTWCSTTNSHCRSSIRR